MSVSVSKLSFYTDVNLCHQKNTNKQNISLVREDIKMLGHCKIKIKYTLLTRFVPSWARIAYEVFVATNKLYSSDPFDIHPNNQRTK